MTIPALARYSHIFIVVPLALKRNILTRVLCVESPGESLPATILNHEPGWLYMDEDSCHEN